MEFTAPQIIYLVVSSIITIGAVITLMRPPLARLGIRDRAFLQMLVYRALEEKLAEMDIAEIVARHGQFKDHEQEPLKR